MPLLGIPQPCHGPLDSMIFFRPPFISLLPWDFPGKSTGVGCHCLLQFISLFQGPGLRQQLWFVLYFGDWLMALWSSLLPFIEKETEVQTNFPKVRQSRWE